MARQSETPEDPRAPDPVVPGPSAETAGSPAAESGERRKAWARGEERARQRAMAEPTTSDLNDVLNATGAAQRAFVALADNVRD